MSSSIPTWIEKTKLFLACSKERSGRLALIAVMIVLECYYEVKCNSNSILFRVVLLDCCVGFKDIQEH